MSDATVAAQPEFLVTKEYRRFAEFCDACRRYRYIGVCYGPPGVGKTLSARRYAQWDSLGPAIQAHRVTLAPPVVPEIVSCHTIVYTPAITVTPRRLAMELEGLQLGMTRAVETAQHPEDYDDVINVAPGGTHVQLIVIDEADRLKFLALEQTRDIYDRTGIAIVLIGMPGLEKRLARYAQLYSRIGFVHHYRPLSQEELRFILTHKWQQLGLALSPDDFTDAEATAAIMRITSGNFRLVSRLFNQIERVLRINELHAITKEVVEAAQESLVIGPL
jgi:DNA transposition AAA+ family ATPase